MKLKKTALLLTAIMIFSAVSALAAENDLRTDISITDSYVGGDVTIIVYTAGSFEHIYNNLLLSDSIIDGNLSIRFIADNGSATDGGLWDPFFEEEDFRGSFRPQLY